MDNLTIDFQLSSSYEIRNFFPTNKHDWKEVLKVEFNRIQHLLYTGIWINKQRLSNWVITHPEEKISYLFKKMPIYRRVFNDEHGLFLFPQSTKQSIWEGLLFLYRFIQSPTTVGSLSPSSDRLARSIVRQIPKDSQEKRFILEVGPGTGTFTDRIIKRMNPQDELHLVEFDHKFCEQLKKKYQHIPNVKIIQADITQYRTENHAHYDFIVSGLPLNAFNSDFVECVFNKFKELIKHQGKISYFEYMFIPQIKMLFNSRAHKDNLQKILRQKQEFYDANKLEKDKIWMNITPAIVRHHVVHQELQA